MFRFLDKAHRKDIPHGDDGWAEITRRANLPEVTVQWTSNNVDNVRLVDVREPSELVSALGKIEDVENVPLRQLTAQIADWDRNQPIIVLCRSGGRSGQAALVMEKMGFQKVASMAGGMLEWNAHKLPLG